MTNQQMLAIEEYIRHSPDAGPMAKRTIIWLLRQTDGLTRPVAVSLPTSLYPNLAAEAYEGSHEMVSSNRSTHLGEFVRSLGSEMTSMHHCGLFERTLFSLWRRRLNTSAPGYTLWWAWQYYDSRPTILQPDLAAILAVGLGPSANAA